MTKKEIIVKGISRQEIEELVDHLERFASCYFWSPPGSASGRRSEEKRQYRYRRFEVETDGETSLVEVEISVSCSCKNYYTTRVVVFGGVRKAQGARFLKSLLAKATFVE